MFRNYLDYNKGMLFFYEDEKRRGFWMKNTFIPLDIIWINQNKEVVFIHKNAKPCRGDTCKTIYPDKKAKYVLELKAAVSDDINLKVGDRLNISIDTNHYLDSDG